MKILLHGATNCGSSNFGDYLYGDAVYRYITRNYPNCQVQFYQPSRYFRKYIRNYREYGITPLTADLILYIPGGYFGEGHQPRFRDNLIHFLRFMPLGLFGVLFRKRIVILGIGAGPIKSLLLKFPIRLIGKRAKLLTVRDPESLQALQIIGLDNTRLTGDLILALNPEEYAEDSGQLQKIKEQCGSQKILFIHYNHSREAMEKFAAAIIRFKQSNETYRFVIGADSILVNEDQLFSEFTQRTGMQCTHYRYNSPYELTRMLMMADAVLTCKLHVGVMASLLGKSVVCIAEHPEKTFRCYRQIAHTERFVSLYDTQPEMIASMLNNYCDTPLQVPKAEIERSKQNWNLLKKTLEDGLC